MAGIAMPGNTMPGDTMSADAMTERQRETALAIKRCLDSLAVDAQRDRLPELAHFLALASMAAEEAANAHDAADHPAQLLATLAPAGRC